MSSSLVLAYADSDLIAVRSLYRRLKEDGFCPWMEAADLLPGQIAATEVPNRIRDARVVLACLSSVSVDRAGGLHKHVRLALNKLAESPPGTIGVIPVRLDPCEFPDHVLEEFGIRLKDIQQADLFEPDGYAKLVESLKQAGLVMGSPAPVEPSDGYRSELLQAFGRLCQGAENAFAANQKPVARYLMESFQSWQMGLEDDLDDLEFLRQLPQFLADRELDIADNLMGHYFNQNPAAEVLQLLNELVREPEPLVDRGDDGESLRERLLASIDEVLAKIRSGASGLDSTENKSAKRALIVLRGEITAPRYNPTTVSQQRATLERLKNRLLERTTLLTEALLGKGFPDLPTGTVFRYVPKLWCPQFVRIPAGKFLMGSLESEAERRDGEDPQHEVTISKPFALGRYAMTFDEYDHFCEVTGREKPHDEGWGRGRRPVFNVSDNDALAYCAWLSDATGGRCQLPSEAMWEYACRAGTMTPFSFGANITTDQVNYDGNSPYAGGAKGEDRRQTVPVGSLPANVWGLHEMHGNVWEWCADWLGDYTSAAVTDPLSSDDGSRVVRGGSWVDGAWNARAALRYAFEPGVRDLSLGFRCAGVQQES